MSVLIRWTVDEVVRNVPEAAAVLARLGIDLCCGGTLTLEEAARAAGLTPEAVLAELRTVATAA